MPPRSSAFHSSSTYLLEDFGYLYTEQLLAAADTPPPDLLPITKDNPYQILLVHLAHRIALDGFNNLKILWDLVRRKAAFQISSHFLHTPRFAAGLASFRQDNNSSDLLAPGFRGKTNYSAFANNRERQKLAFNFQRGYLLPTALNDIRTASSLNEVCWTASPRAGLAFT